MSKKLIPIYVLEILKEHSAKNRTLRQRDILYYLERDYNIRISRNTLSVLLEEMRQDGYITGSRGVSYVNQFSVQELRLLIDGVLYGRHIPESEAKQIIEKLKAISPLELRDKVKNVIYLEDMNHTPNDTLYEIMDQIDIAIEKNRAIEVERCNYDIDGRLHFIKKKIVHPYYLVADKSRYYLICYDEEWKCLVNLRLDRIRAVKISDMQRYRLEDVSGYAGSFDLAEYMKEHIYMFSGENEYIYLKIKKDNIGDFIDWFGKDYRVVETNGETIMLRFKANVNAVYYWALQYGAVAEVVKPEGLRKKLYEGVSEMKKKYEG